MKRGFGCKTAGMLVTVTILALAGTIQAAGPAALEIGSRRELFVDRYLVDRLDNVRYQLHHPVPAETAIAFDRPYEGVFSAYVTVIKDGPIYRMYYRGLAATKDGSADHSVDTEVTCYAESTDGIHFTKPSLKLFDVQGSRDNNIILTHSKACHNFSPFLDNRPGVDPAERYKALGGHYDVGLLGFVSADGIHWRQLDKALIRKGAFDSQNLAFWSEAEQCYVAYFRIGKKINDKKYRWVSRSTSKDFRTWTEPVEMDMGDTPPVHYYTNQTAPYFRAPHIYLAIFARFVPDKKVNTDEELRRIGLVGDYGHDCSDVGLMSTRGGQQYDRTFQESFVRPGLGSRHWISRTNYPALGVVPTGPGEISLYIQRDYGQPSHHLQRLTLRTDGFASINAPFEGGEMVTKPLMFTGRELTLNFSASAAGEIRVEIQTPDGTPIPGYTLNDAVPCWGDELDKVVAWKAGSDVSKLAGQPVRLRFVMNDADLYALRFH